MAKYHIETKHKRSIVEWEYFVSDSSDILISLETMWRGGTFEIDTLPDESLPDADNADGFYIDEFQNWEVVYLWDGTDLGIYVDSRNPDTVIEDEVRQEFLDALNDSDVDVYAWLDDNGFYSEDTSFEISGELLITPIDD